MRLNTNSNINFESESAHKFAELRSLPLTSEPCLGTIKGCQRGDLSPQQKKSDASLQGNIWGENKELSRRKFWFCQQRQNSQSEAGGALLFFLSPYLHWGRWIKKYQQYHHKLQGRKYFRKCIMAEGRN